MMSVQVKFITELKWFEILSASEEGKKNGKKKINDSKLHPIVPNTNANAVVQNG